MGYKTLFTVGVAASGLCMAFAVGCTANAGHSSTSEELGFEAHSVSGEIYTVGGNASGIPAGGVTLVDNGTDILTVKANGPFTFPTKLANGAKYAVTVKVPDGEACGVYLSAGTIQSANVTNVVVQCWAATACPPVGNSLLLDMTLAVVHDSPNFYSAASNANGPTGFGIAQVNSDHLIHAVVPAGPIGSCTRNVCSHYGGTGGSCALSTVQQLATCNPPGVTSSVLGSYVAVIGTGGPGSCNGTQPATNSFGGINYWGGLGYFGGINYFGGLSYFGGLGYFGGLNYFGGLGYFGGLNYFGGLGYYGGLSY